MASVIADWLERIAWHRLRRLVINSARARAEGRAMTLEQAVAYALDEPLPA